MLVRGVKAVLLFIAGTTLNCGSIAVRITQWMLMNAFPAGGDQAITVAEANKRMPCMKGRLQSHFPGLEQQAAEMKKELGLDNPVKARRMRLPRLTSNYLI